MKIIYSEQGIFMNKTVNLPLLVNYFCGLCLGIWMVFPMFFRNTPNVIVIFLFLVWIMSAFAICVFRNVIIDKKYFIIVSWLLLILLSFFVRNTGVHFFRIIKQIFFWIPLLLYVFYSRNGKKEYNRIFLRFLIVATVISFALNIVILIMHPEAGLDVVRNEDSIYRAMNVGDTSQSFFASLFALYLYVSFRSKNAIFSRLFLCFFGIVTLALIAIMGRALSVLVLLMGIVIIELNIGSAREKSIKMLLLCFGAIVAFVMIINYNSIISFLSSFFSSDNRVIDRLKEIGNIFFEGNWRTRDLSGSTRLSLYGVSIKTWLSTLHNFFVGVGELDMAKTENFLIVGHHSEIFDLLAKYGIIGAILFFGSFICSMKICCKRVCHNGMLRCFYLVFFAYGLFNGFVELPATGLFLFLILPFGLEAIYE